MFTIRQYRFNHSKYIFFICLKKRLYQHVHNSTVSFCVNYIILITQNIYFFILRIYILYAKKTIISTCS
jgi:hypothetical protein